jgi:hypothetical protein
MTDPTTDPDARPEREVPVDGESGETPLERAEEIYDEVAAENPDPVTRREAIEGELEDEGLSDEGGVLGEHNE